MKELTLYGKKIPIKNEKLRLTILSSQELDLELERSENHEHKMNIYDKILICYNDALKIIRDELQNLAVCGSVVSP